MYNKGSTLPIILAAGAILGLMTLSNVLFSIPSSREATMYIAPSELTAVPGDLFSVTIDVTSGLPVNAFTGVVRFNTDILSVDKIDYNTSIADLWTEEPWFNQGAGSVQFTGGTTRPSGFRGTGTLITITFKAVATGDAELGLHEARILQHDGLGTDTPLGEPIDTIFTVVPESLHAIVTPDTSADITVIKTFAPSDLNRDGKISFQDISIFMMYLATGDQAGDVSGDGRVNTTDLSIVLDARNR